MTNEERIKADAEAYASGTGDFYRKMGALFGYIAGATAENSRSQALVDALEEIIKMDGHMNGVFNYRKVANKALEQWKGKEVEPPKPVASNCGMCGKLGNNQYLGNQFYLCDECFEDYEKGRDQPTPY